MEYEALLAMGNLDFEIRRPNDEWCFTWAVAAQGGTNVCLRMVNAKDIFECISRHKVTHMGGAPTVLNMTSYSIISDFGRMERWRSSAFSGGVQYGTAGVRGVSHKNIWFRNSLHMETRVEFPTTRHTSQNQITTRSEPFGIGRKSTLRIQ
ncbi:hypothetical protein CTI12_AA036320 [Artemisia annua]|uniref:Uncharacterized protein n=1 Tax=Artemisia annua TaxID=35608 RepID=A0A2U1QFC1_ARTAN|nr:hypothetical protein CTI12_AA036320 [Artemisia annua]